MANKTTYGITRIKDSDGNWKPVKKLWQKTASGWQEIKTGWLKVGPDSWERIYPAPAAGIKPSVDSLSFTTYQNHYYNDNTNGQIVTITNVGDQDLRLTSVGAQDTNNYISTIRLVNIQGNVLPANIRPNASANISFNVYGKAIGNSAGTLTFTGISGVLGTVSSTIPITVSVIPEYSSLAVNPTTISYAMIDGSTLPAAQLTISNRGNGLGLNILSITSKYGYTSIGSYSQNLAYGASTSIRLTAYREPVGVYQDVIVITTDSTTTPTVEVVVNLTVTAKRPSISIAPQSITFTVENLSNQNPTPETSTTQIVLDLSDPAKYILGQNANVAPHYQFSRPWYWSNYTQKVLQPPQVDNIEVTSVYNKILDFDNPSSYALGTNTEVEPYNYFVYNNRQLNAPTIGSNVAIFGWQPSQPNVEERTITSSQKIDLTHVSSLVYEINQASVWWGWPYTYRGENLKVQYSTDGTTWVDMMEHNYYGPWSHSYYNYYYYWYGYYGWRRYYLLNWYWRREHWHGRYYSYWYYGNGWARMIVSVPDAARGTAGGVYLRYYQRRTGAVNPPQDTWVMSSLSTLASNVAVFGFSTASSSKEVRTLTSRGKVVLQDVDKLIFQVNKGTSTGWGDAPEPGESIQFQYSIDGNTWANVISIAPSQVADNKWTTFVSPVPGPAKAATGVYLRYYQQKEGYSYPRDTWAMTSVGATTWIVPSPSANVSIFNPGDGTLAISSVTSESNLCTFTNVPTLIDPGSLKSFIVTATGVRASKTDRIIITSNSSSNSVTYIPVTYNFITRTPKMVVTPTSITFGERDENELSRQLAKISITNTATGPNAAPLSITSVSALQGRVTLSNIPVSIDPGTTQELDIDIPDWDRYEQFDTVVVKSDDPVTPTANVLIFYAYTSKYTGISLTPSRYTIPDFKVNTTPTLKSITVLNSSSSTANLYIGAGNIVSKSGNIKFTNVPGWINPGRTATFTANFATYSSYPAGVINDAIYVNSNDTFTPNVAIPIRSNVIPRTANIAINSTSPLWSSTTGLNFYGVARDTGSSSTLTANVTIYNSGDRNLTISSITTEVGYGDIIAPAMPWTITANTSGQFKITTSSYLTPGLNSDRIVINSDADNGAVYKIPYVVDITVSHGSQRYNSAGTYQWITPTWINQANVYITGGGGGGGASQTIKSKSGSGGSGSTGGTASAVISDISKGTVFTVVVGAGGAGGRAVASYGSYYTGSPGGVTYFANVSYGNLIALGGSGGGIGSNATPTIGGAGGSAVSGGLPGNPGAGTATATAQVSGGAAAQLYKTVNYGTGGAGAPAFTNNIPYSYPGNSGISGNVYIVW